MSSSEENVLPWLRKVENDLLNIENNLAAGVPTNRITAIIKEGRGITGDTAVRLATFFNTSAEFWMNLQKTYETSRRRMNCGWRRRRCRAGSENISSSRGKHWYRRFRLHARHGGPRPHT